MVFEQDFKIGLSDLNSERELRNVSILRFLEDAGGFHSDYAKMGINDIFAAREEIGHRQGASYADTAWALLDWEVRVLRRPRYGEDVRVVTWAREMSKCYAFRDFELYANGEKCVAATSKWLLLNLRKRFPAMIRPEAMLKYEPEYGKSAFAAETLGRMEEYKDYEGAGSYTVRRSDIDINGHMHNLYYLDIVTDTFSEGEAADMDWFHISYKKEIRLGDTVKILRHEEDLRSAASDGMMAESSPPEEMEAAGVLGKNGDLGAGGRVEDKAGKKLCFLLRNAGSGEIHALIEMV